MLPQPDHRAHTHGPCTRQGGPCRLLRPDISLRQPGPTQLNANGCRRWTHLSASSGQSRLCECGTPTARNRVLRQKQMWLIAIDRSRWGCDTGFLCQTSSGPQLMPSQGTLMFVPSLAAPGPAHDHACPQSDSQGLPLTQLQWESISCRALSYCVCKALLGI